MAKYPFKSEVNQLLHLIIHSLYSHKEIFLRELMSNASDALDKLKYLTLTNDEFKQIDFKPQIDIMFDEKDQKTLTIADTGIGMNQEELADNLGTIANSGTKNFLNLMTGDVKKDSNLIGQFGVGFYSVYMVADKVEVVSRKAGEEKAYKWTSDGKGEYEIEDAKRDRNGTTITLYLNEEGKDFTSRWSIESVVKKYSNHIAYPIFLHFSETKTDDKGKKQKSEMKVEQINTASALWKRSKDDLKEEDYNEFYKTISHDTDDPLTYVHTHAEGALEYTTLFYIPKKAPPDMFRVDYKSGVKLYVKRVFITDDDKELLPAYLRFVRGIIDSEDLPLNVSRELLQKNRILANIKSASVKKILSEIGKLSLDKEKYKEFYGEFRKPLKEGLYEDFTNRDTLLDLIRFKSTKSEDITSLSEYKQRMKPDQKFIYYLTGENVETLKNSPLIEVYRKEDIEVLLMDDEVDELVIPMVIKYKDIEFKSVNRSDAASDLKSSRDNKVDEKEIKPLIEKIKEKLKEEVKDVKISYRLSDSPSCVVADETDPSIQLQHIMKAMGQKDLPQIKPILEINPEHEIIKKLGAVSDDVLFEDISKLLFEQAILIEGVELKNPTQFTKRLNKILARAL
ncbi:MAG: molecular chaperone HtpG [Spirochaetales bacterium]|nr:molecular chaperone HtpG [Spirochaetales bacterium]